MLSEWQYFNKWPSPTASVSVKILLREARQAHGRYGIKVRRKTAAVLEPLQALLAICTDSVRGIRGRAPRLVTWSGGGRRRSEVVGLSVDDVSPRNADTWIYTLGATKTNTSGVRREKPLRGTAANTLAA